VGQLRLACTPTTMLALPNTPPGGSHGRLPPRTGSQRRWARGDQPAAGVGGGVQCRARQTACPSHSQEWRTRPAARRLPAAAAPLTVNRPRGPAAAVMALPAATALGYTPACTLLMQTAMGTLTTLLPTAAMAPLTKATWPAGIHPVAAPLSGPHPEHPSHTLRLPLPLAAGAADGVHCMWCCPQAEDCARPRAALRAAGRACHAAPGALLAAARRPHPTHHPTASCALSGHACWWNRMRSRRR